MPSAFVHLLLKTQRRLALSLLLSLSIVELPCLAVPPGKTIVLQGDVSSYGILTDDVQSELGIKCQKDGSGLIRIQQVRLGSEAARQRLRAGDAILDAGENGSTFYITIEREGRTYQVRFGGQSEQPQSAPNVEDSGPQFRLRANQVGESQARVLANYNVEIIIDRSMSMRKPDCPGGLSRWQWCGYQASAIVRALAPYAPGGQTVTRFATQFDVHEHANAQHVSQLLSTPDFQFGTRLCEPLSARLDYHFAHHRNGDRPTLIAVITDGCPYPRPEPRMVVETLVNASYRMRNPDEVTVVFLQIGGDDPGGRNYLLNLGTNLVSGFGARCQFVRTKTFDQIANVGLAQALVDSVQQTSRPAGTPVATRLQRPAR